MAIADVFEALTADDRPYKTAKKLSEAMRIMGFMKRDNHLDPDLFDVFVRSGVYKKYAEQFLNASLIDNVDEEALLSIQPKDFEVPPAEQRSARRQGFLSDYEARFPLREDSKSPFAPPPSNVAPSDAPPSIFPGEPSLE
jgi:hypothetical protein